MSEATVPAEAAPQATKGFLARVIGVIFSPGETFEDVRRKPTILLPMITLLLLMMAIFYVIFPAQLADNQARFEANPRMQQLSAEQRDQILARSQGPAARIASTIIGPVAIVIFSMFFALLYWGGAHLLGGEPTYKAMLSMVFFVGLLNPGLHFLLKAPLMLAKGTVIGVTFGPAIFMPELPTTSLLYTGLAILDLFNLWAAIVAGIGIAKIARISTAMGMLLAFAVFAIGAAIQIGIAAAFS